MYILPTPTPNASGGQPAHIAAPGEWPLCGARRPAEYITDVYLYAWNLCEACRLKEAAGAPLQAGLFDDLEMPAGAGVKVWK
jgi:hypothetical protein